MTTGGGMDPVMEQVRAAAARRGYLRVEREAVAARRMYGFVLAASDELMLMQEIYDFTPDGYAIVRLRDVTAIRDGESERFDERVLEGEGVRVAPPQSAIDVASWRTVFASLAGGEWPLVLVESESDGDVWVGRVLGAGDTAAWFHYVSPVGVWDAEPEEIDYDDVTLVRFGDRYTTVLARYVDA